MQILTRYILLRLTGPLVLAILLFAGLIWLLQALRLGHHLLGSEIGLVLLSRLLLYSLPTLLIYAIPLALPAAIVFTLVRMKNNHELLAMQLAGASIKRIAWPAIAISAFCAAIVWCLAAYLEVPAIKRLFETAYHGATRALVLGAQPGRFHDLLGGTTLYAGRKITSGQREAHFEGFFLARQKPRLMVLFAHQARITLDRSRVMLFLRRGELQMKNRHGGLRRIRFKTLEKTLDLGQRIGSHLGFIQHLSQADRQITASLACFTLGFLVIVIGLGRGSSPRVVCYSVVAALTFQLVLWGFRILWIGPLGQLWGPIVLSVGVIVGGMMRLGGSAEK